MRFLIITGMSGAGKTQVMHSLEDMGYYCIDNLPVAFLLPFAKMCNEEKENSQMLQLSLIFAVVKNSLR